MDSTKTDSFWDIYIEKSQGYKLPDRSVRWYVRHVEDYLQSLEDKKLPQHLPSDVDRYLSAKGRKPLITDWQFEQIVDALRVLYQDVIQTSWAASFNWAYWKASSKSLEGSYEFIEREHPHTYSAPAFSYGIEPQVGRM